MEKLELKGRWVLVTGGSGGIGRAIALRMASEGAKIILVARRESALLAVQKQLPTESKVIVADLQTPAGVDSLFAAVSDLAVEVEHVVNNAGFGDTGAFVGQDLDSATAQLQVNCIALTRITQHFLPAMLERGTGGVLQVASVVGFMPTPFMAVYAATKAYVVSFAASLSEELSGTGVHCTALCPGPVATSFQKRAGYEFSDLERRAELTTEQVANIAVKAYLRRRRVIVPGANNRLLAWLGKHMPHALGTRITASVLRKSGRA